MKRLAVFTAVAAGFASSFVAVALASEPASIQEAAQHPAYGPQTSFETLVAYKGTPGLVSAHGCGKGFVAGDTYTVFASDRNGVLRSDCSFTQKGVVPPQKILTTGTSAGQAVGASPDAAPPESSSGESFFSGPLFWILFRIAAALAIPVYLLFWTRMRRRRT